MEKMFKACGQCPYTGYAIDSPACRSCKSYVRAGTEFFVWCGHEGAKAIDAGKKMKIAVAATDERAKERPDMKLSANKKTATRKPASTKQRAKGKAKQTKTANKAKKRGRPRKAK